jgi:D-aminoacyl-tRNA deacylase
MRVVLQRVSSAKVTLLEKVNASIEFGLLVLVGIEEADTVEDCTWLSQKIINLRIFPDQNGVMNLSVKEINGEILVISQFTLHAATKKGNRPSYLMAAKPEIALPLYEKFIVQLSTELGKKVGTGIFGATMKVELTNEGPVTICIDTKKRE